MFLTFSFLFCFILYVITRSWAKFETFTKPQTRRASYRLIQSRGAYDINLGGWAHDVEQQLLNILSHRCSAEATVAALLGHSLASARISWQCRNPYNVCIHDQHCRCQLSNTYNIVVPKYTPQHKHIGDGRIVLVSHVSTRLEHDHGTFGPCLDFSYASGVR